MSLLQLNARSLWHALFALIVLVDAHVCRPALAHEASKPGGGGSYELTSDDRAQLNGLTQQAKDDTQLVITIYEKTAGLKLSTKAYLVAKTEALRIFKALVQEGVDPARIKLLPAQGGGGSKVKVESAKHAAAKTTAKLVPSAIAAAGTKEFIINFASGSAEPLSAGDEGLQAFLKGVGQPGHDATVIEGHTDSTGRADYNKVLSELRALRVFEILVRAGLPPYRIDARGATPLPAAAHESEASRQAARRVTIRWAADAKIAAVAVKAEASPPPAPPPPPLPQVKEEPKSAPIVKKLPEPEKTPATTKRLLDVFAFGGVILPGGELQHKAKPGATYGLGISTNVWENGGGDTVRVNLLGGTTRLTDRAAGLNGPLKINYGILRADYLLKMGPVTPYAGVGAGYYLWKGTITNGTIPATNSSDQHDGGYLFAGGLDVPLTDYLTLEPEIAVHRIVGAFNESIWSLWLVIRWSL